MSQLRLVTDEGDPGPSSPPIVALFCGSRDFNDQAIIETLVHGVSEVSKLRGRPMVMVEGEARGAGILSRLAAEQVGIEVRKYKVTDDEWKRIGRAAGILRNQRMLEEQRPHVVVAFSDDIENSKGTSDMCRRAREAGVPVYVVSRYMKEGP